MMSTPDPINPLVLLAALLGQMQVQNQLLTQLNQQLAVLIAGRDGVPPAAAVPATEAPKRGPGRPRKAVNGAAEPDSPSEPQPLVSGAAVVPAVPQGVAQAASVVPMPAPADAGAPPMSYEQFKERFSAYAATAPEEWSRRCMDLLAQYHARFGTKEHPIHRFQDLPPEQRVPFLAELTGSTAG
jgi:hypothetical protein